MRLFSLCLLIILSPLCRGDNPASMKANTPDWLNAVGTLVVPGYRYEDGERRSHLEHCSATLVANNLILSGWHCLEFYGDLSRDIEFALPGSGAPQVRTARAVADGGGMDADWVLLRLNRPIDTAFAKPVPVSRLTITRPGAQALSVAGFAGSRGAPGNNAVANYRATCHILENEWYRVKTDCPASKGDSGGPVVHDNTLVGVVSAGDGAKLTYYTPSDSFFRALRRHIQ